MKGMLNYIRKYRRAQTTVEYLIFVAVVLAILIAFMAPGRSFHTNLNRTLVSSAAHWRDVALSIFR